MIDFEYTAYDDEDITFTANEIQQLNMRELADYEEKVPMTPAEKRILRKWVASGHSVKEHPASRYVSLYGAWPPPDFLTVYRMDKEIQRGLKGKTKAEQVSYLKRYTGYEEAAGEEEAERIAREQTPDLIKARIRKLERELFYIWLFLSQEGLCEEAHDFVADHKNEPIPFEFD